MPIFRVKSVKIYTGKKKFTLTPSVASVTIIRYEPHKLCHPAETILSLHLWQVVTKIVPWWCQYDFMFLSLYSRNVNMFSERIPSCSIWGYWNWLMLTKRLLNQLLSANTIHSILGSFYLGNFLSTNSLGNNLTYLANIIDMTSK